VAARKAGAEAAMVDSLTLYERWRVLREMQCKNPRSLRDYCKH
jgi:hypothetical protein